MVKSNKEQSNEVAKINPWVVRIIGLIICLVVPLLWFNVAWAQSDDWIRPVVDVIDSVSLGIRLAGGALVGIVVLIAVIKAMTTGNINWKWHIALVGVGLSLLLVSLFI